jgi:magnesium transporter
MIEKLVSPDITELIRANDIATLRDVLPLWSPPDLAALMERLADHDQAVVLRAVPTALAATTFEYLDLATQQQVLRQLSPEEVAGILNAMAPDDRTALLEEVPGSVATQLLALLTPQEQEVAQSLLAYGKGSIGRLMTPDYIAVHEDWTVKHVLDYVRTHGKDRETLNVVYVVDDTGKLIDDIRMREFLLAPLPLNVRDLMDHQFVTLVVTDEKQTAVAAFGKYDRTALPVVDTRGVLVGLVTVDDVLDIAEREATRALQQFGGVEALEDPYIATPLRVMIQKRASWLVILFLGEMLTATAMGFFEAEIARAVVLALFVPLIISSGGNSGSQAATLIIRALALGEVTLRDWWRVMRREVVSGGALGLILGTIGVVMS